MKKKLVLIGIGILFVFLLLLGTYKLMNSRTYQLFGGLTKQVETHQKVVALTFDDGPADNTNQILSLLEEYNAKATFFLIGSEIEKFPEEARKIAEEGHQIGNHTYSHKRMIFKTPTYYKDEIEKTDQLIQNAGYKGEIDVRPPNGKKLIGLPYYLNKHKRETITWNLEPDTFYTTVSDKVKYVTENIEPGSIILLHPMYDKTGQALQTIEGILQELSKKGYTFITVNELQDL
ncbi:polysaccharide deacetylase family protein [Lysinibacillus sp. CNPSo 3705]|uniref:polysaccharide deacetylase family protein n=1 Tax=Lysinibacillus sp. CNPSo 3705 TaxID=3028148 RepID=UPI002363C0B6|nr:polysaccharide deacetylase family protein [Lysinibacillus sp. CNPSo 3705]MDD1501718.1 polysaccharide deacetylase family protein [Lysinibacillus sp. CNPSo 3705]